MVCSCKTISGESFETQVTRHKIDMSKVFKAIKWIVGFFILFIIVSYLEGMTETFVIDMFHGDFSSINMGKLAIIFTLFILFIFLTLAEGHFENTIMNFFKKLDEDGNE